MEFLIGSLRKIPGARRNNHPPLSPTRIGVIRLDNIGDFILWLNGARAIRKRYPAPAYRLTLIAPVAWSTFAFASGLFDDVFEIDRDRFRGDQTYRKKALSELRAAHFDTLINPTFSRSFETDDRIVRSTRVKTVIGSCGDHSNTSPFRKMISDSRYTRLVPVNPASRHEIERNNDFARFFDPSSRPDVPRLPPSMISWPAWLEQSAPYFVLCSGASLPGKIWPRDRFAAVARRLHQRTGWRGVVCGSADERKAGDKLIALLGDVPMENAAGRTSLAELAGVIATAEIVVTNDTGAVHLAAATRTRTVCIAGGGHFERFVPYPGNASVPLVTVAHRMPCFHCNWRCIYPEETAPFRCVGEISVEAVWAGVEKILDDAFPRQNSENLFENS